MSTGGSDEAAERVDHKLGYMADEVDMLEETLAEWTEISENERSIWQFEWSNHLAILQSLVRACDASDMSAEQERLVEVEGGLVRPKRETVLAFLPPRRTP